MHIATLEESVAKLKSTIESTEWKDYEKDADFQGFTMKEEGRLCTKSVGILPCTPIEVRLQH